MILLVESLENQTGNQVSLPLVLGTTREKAQQVIRNSARMPLIIGFAMISATIIAAVIAIIFVAEDTKTILLIAGIAIVALAADVFLVNILKKTSANSAAALASDGATVLVVDQYGIKVGDKMLPLERITGIVYRRIAPQDPGNSNSKNTYTFHLEIGLDQISSIARGGIATTPRSGTGTEAGSLGFTFTHFLTIDDLSAFAAAARQISNGFPVREINNAHWQRMRAQLGASRDEIKKAAEEFAAQQ